MDLVSFWKLDKFTDKIWLIYFITLKRSHFCLFSQVILTNKSKATFVLND